MTTHRFTGPAEILADHSFCDTSFGCEVRSQGTGFRGTCPVADSGFALRAKTDEALTDAIREVRDQQRMLDEALAATQNRRDALTAALARRDRAEIAWEKAQQLP